MTGHPPTVTATTGTATFTTKQAPLATATLTAIAVQPKVKVVAANGSGTITVTPKAVVKSTAHAFVFKYTETGGSMTAGKLTDHGSGRLDGSCRPRAAAGQGEVDPRDGRGDRADNHGHRPHLGHRRLGHVTYGATGHTATAPATTGTATFTTKQTSVTGGTLATLAVQPKVKVVSTAGSGTMTVAPTAAPQVLGSLVHLPLHRHGRPHDSGQGLGHDPRGLDRSHPRRSGGPGEVDGRHRGGHRPDGDHHRAHARHRRDLHTHLRHTGTP